MIIPSTYQMALLLAVIAMVCFGAWAIPFKLSGKWRFELFYFDFAFGLVVAAGIAALTFGSMGDELSFWDNLSLTAGRRNIAWAMGAGVLLNLALMLLLAATSISAISVAFPVSLGVSLVTACVWNAFSGQQFNTTYLVIGCALVLLAVVMNAIAFRAHAATTQEDESERRKAMDQLQAETAAAEVPAGDDRSYRRRKKRDKADKDAVGTPLKGLILAIMSGLILGSTQHLVEASREGELGLGPYTLMFVVSIVAFLSSFVFNLYFMNLPVQGAPVQFFRYFQGTIGQHLCGLLSGAIWAIGATAAYVLAATPKAVNTNASLTLTLVQAAPVVALVLGWLLWREFKQASGFVNGLMAMTLVLLCAGLGIISLAAQN
jgi:glucose uptake protein